MAKRKYYWVRLGDADDYHEFDDLHSACYYIAEGLPEHEYLDFIWRPTYGLIIEPYYRGLNYISFYVGDEEAQPIRELTKKEKKQAEATINRLST